LSPNRRIVCIVTFVVGTSCLGFGQIVEPVEQPAIQQSNSVAEPSSPSWTEELFNLPVVRFFTSLFEPAQQVTAAPLDLPQPAGDVAHPANACPVAGLDLIIDPAAEQLEASMGADVVDVTDMVPAAAAALGRFQSKVAAVGGSVVLKSAYRPAAYQQHLQNVWYKWMGELRNNNDPACQELREQVHNEFTMHRLIETQHPVAVSDHTRGLAFDATVALPAKWKGRRRVTLDGLARTAGLTRPAIAADPVHFKFTGGIRSVATARRHRRGIA
jgi:D-alanyl-D-alanine dipeptidase